MLLCGCDLSHGRPGKDSETPAPDEILDFAILYAENCAGCHGTDGRGGAAIALANPVYLAIADEAAMRRVTAGGVRGTSMPAFAQSAGGMLTDKQIDVITMQIRARWARPGILAGVEAPSYENLRKSAGDAARGELAYKTYCESCHGATVVIVGRPELNAPDWRGNVPGRPMSEQEVTDVVAWLASKRMQTPGQPYPTAQNTPAPGAR
jgi:cytochrome c oxidase cbb3-type subunit 3